MLHYVYQLLANLVCLIWFIEALAKNSCLLHLETILKKLLIENLKGKDVSHKIS